MKIIGIIPARYTSSRFPGKPLADIKGKPMIRHVYEQAKKCKALSEVIVATDDVRIEKAVNSFGGKAIMTSSKHKSGTDRCYEALKKIGRGKFHAVINIQGDEPFIHPEQILKVAELLKNKNTELATLLMKIKTENELANPNIIKAIVNKNKEAIYFSRTAIPYYREKDFSEWAGMHIYYKHIGIYGYRSDILEKITRLKPSSLEIVESLEQLRWLENGYTIMTQLTTHQSRSIDTPQDLEDVVKTLK